MRRVRFARVKWLRRNPWTREPALRARDCSCSDRSVHQHACVREARAHDVNITLPFDNASMIGSLNPANMRTTTWIDMRAVMHFNRSNRVEVLHRGSNLARAGKANPPTARDRGGSLLADDLFTYFTSWL
jgi:hypothetical protein